MASSAAKHRYSSRLLLMSWSRRLACHVHRWTCCLCQAEIVANPLASPKNRLVFYSSNIVTKARGAGDERAAAASDTKRSAKVWLSVYDLRNDLA